MNSRWKMRRRTALKGMGVTLGLPLLEAMTPLAKAASGKPPVRLLFLYVPGGVNVDAWRPQAEGAAYEASPTLSALQPVRQDVLVLSGLNGRQNETGANGHPLGCAPWLSSAPINERDRGGYSTGISIDQIAAGHIGRGTRLPSLELGCDRDATQMHTSNISWRGPASPMGKETDPRAVYSRLFGDPQGGDERQLLDLVLEDARSIRQRLGALDRQKLDEYLDSVRSIERRIELSQRENKQFRPPEIDLPDTIPAQYLEHLRLMLDLLVLGLANDSTRVCTFMLNNEAGRGSWPEIGVPEGHHTLAHLDPRSKEGQHKLTQLAKIDRCYLEQLVYLIEKMKGVRESHHGTLLDNSMIMYGSGLAWGRLHNRDNLPILLAGGGSGTIQGGRHINHGGVPLANLYLSLLDRVGVKLDRVADSTDRLPQLTA